MNVTRLIKFFHTPVFLREAINYLKVKPNGIYVDCTFGMGGHFQALVDKLNRTGKLIAFDWDKNALSVFNEKFKYYKNCIFINGNFKNLKIYLNQLNIFKVDGFLFDFGVSSPMFDDPKRGFSYLQDGRLDMRMNQNQTFDAYELINNYSKEKLIDIFTKYGEVQYPFQVVNGILNARRVKPIRTTLQLVEIIKISLPKKIIYQKKHFAKTYFQAIRMAVNDELNNLTTALHSALEMLNVNGRIVTISFHSLEEKTIKKVYRQYLQPYYPNEVPINNEVNYKLIKVESRQPSLSEININNRAKSAFIKVISRIN